MNTIQELTLNAPVSVVTVLEDRALVRRLGKATLQPGQWRIRVEGVAPVLSDKSLRAEWINEYSDAYIDDVRVRRQQFIRDEQQPEQVQKLLEELRSLYNQFNEISEDRQHLEKSFNEFNTILNYSLQEIPVDAIWGQLDPKSWREHFQTLFYQLRSLRREILSDFQDQTKLHQEINNLLSQIDALSRPDWVYTATLETDIRITHAGEYEIAFDYVVPNALWRPAHQARLQFSTPETPPQLTFHCQGCVWQRTGEDWNNVDLILSTARASLGTEPPLLVDDPLSVQEKSEEIVVKMRDQTVQTTGLGTTTLPTSVQLPGVEDGGEVRNLRSSYKATIPSDGRPYRVPLFSFDAASEVEYVLMPELSCQVILKSQQTNQSSFPILAGPVDLIRNQEFVGKTSILFIAPGESFALGWGPDAALRVQRTQTQKQKRDHITKWNILIIKTQLFLSNIGAEERVIKTIERIPVSELEHVKVEGIAEETTHPLQPDENGFCTWTFTLPAYSQQQATWVYKISAAPEVQGIV